MKLHLRKARKLEASIQTHLDSTRVTAVASIRVLGTIEEAKASVEEARKLALAKLPERETLLALRYEIRRQIEVQNEQLGINALINRKVLVDALSREAGQSITAVGAEGLQFEDTFNMQVAQYHTPSDRYGSHKSIIYTANAFSLADYTANQTKKLEFKREIDQIEDKLGELNIVGKVTLTDVEVKLLQTLGLV